MDLLSLVFQQFVSSVRYIWDSRSQKFEYCINISVISIHKIVFLLKVILVIIQYYTKFGSNLVLIRKLYL